MTSPILRLLVSACLFCIFCSAVLGASLEINITPKHSGQPIQPDSLRYETSAKETYSITRISYLAAGFALQRPDGSWLELTNQVAWFDLERNRAAHRIAAIPSGTYRALRFYLGPDEKVNHADPAQLPAQHPLNPNLNNLHWSWQGGYIFLAVEGMWRNRGGSLDGWSYHFARDPNRTAINLAVPLDLTRDTKLELDFDLATLLNAPRPISFGKDGSSTHSRAGDPIAAALAANLPGAFQVQRVSAPSAAVSAGAGVRPLYLPEKITPYRFEMSATFPLPDLPRDNPLLEERVTLGEKLFREPLLSKDGTISCASCHDLRHAFTDPRRYSLGVRNQTGARNGMPLFNLAWKNSFFWDGRAASLRTQALMPIQDHTEMDESLTNVVAKLAGQRNPLASKKRQVPSPTHGPVASAGTATAVTSTPGTPSPQRGEGALAPTRSQGANHGFSRDVKSFRFGRGEGEGKSNTATNYPALFTAAFGSPEITSEKIGLALENFLLTLTSFDAKFDQVLKGEVTFTAPEQRGFELFMTEFDPRRGQFGADCFHCHGGPLFQSQTFSNNGLDSEFADAGRAKITGKDSDQGKFATPSLRNIALTAPYMHDGRFRSLEDVVGHYDRPMRRSPTLDPNLAKHPPEGLRLSKYDKDALVAFLKTLTDEKYSK